MIDLSTAGIRGAVAITASDTDQVDQLYPQRRAIWVGTSGNLALDLGGGSVTFNSVPVGWFSCPGVKKVLSTGTTASDLVLVW